VTPARRLVVLGAVLLLAGCGSTVNQTALGTTQAGAAGSGGLGAPAGAQQQSGDTVLPGAVGAPVPGGAAPVGGSGGSRGTAAGPSSAAVPGASAPVAGGTTVTAPLKLGITYIDNSQSSEALGVDDESTVDMRHISQALVKGINAAGGMHGRRLEPTYFQFNGQSADYSTQAAEACAQFTQDQKVTVVVDTAFGATGGFRECLQKSGVLSLTTQYEGDRVSSRAASLHASPSGMVLDREYTAVLEQLAATKYIGSGNQLGVVVEGCPDVDRAWNNTLAPLVKRLGLKAPVVRRFTCAVGYSSLAGAGSSTSAAVLAFRQAGVDRVMFVSHFQDVLLLLFGPAAESQGYRPGYLLSSGAQPHSLRTQLPDGQWAGFHGVGHEPYGDTDAASPAAGDQRCLQLVKSGGLQPATHDDYGLVLSLCAPYVLLDETLGRTGGASDARSLMSAINGLGSRFVAPGTVAGRSRFGPDRHDGGDAVRVFAYLPSCQCIRYTSPVRPAPQ
jgi:ABC-type branched-subunit amino acid transport system substrate-binding protein